MSHLVISRASFELARAKLNSPILVVGRSPTCDIVLRAPGVKPAHFLIEWVGEGDFDPEQSEWNVTDISHIPHNQQTEPISAEGHLLQLEETLLIDGFSFFIEKLSHASTTTLGGAIQRELLHASPMPSLKEKLVEVVWIKTDSGAVQEVLHLPLKNAVKKKSLFRDLPGVSLRSALAVANSQEEASYKIHLESMPDSLILLRGEIVSPQQAVLKENDFFQVQWKNETLFFRFVRKVEAPPVERIGSDTLLFKIAFFNAVIFSLFLGYTFFFEKEVVNEIPEPPRVARLEVQEIIEAPSVAPEEPVTEAAVTQPTEKESTPEKEAGLANLAPNANPAQAAKSRYKSENGKSRLGLNSPAPSTDVNQVGILGMLNQNKGAKGPGVKADLIINDGIQAQTLSGDKGAGVIIKNPPAGVIGSGLGGDPNGKNGKGLSLSAATTLRNAGDPDPTSIGAIAKNGGTSEFTLGTGSSKGGSGLSGGKESAGFDASGWSVVGGLDRETVRRVIAGNRGKVRVCYDKALLTNPKVKGRVVYNWQISPMGNVTQVSIAKSEASSQVLESCVQDVIKDMLFPKAPNGLPTTVIYPFEFFSK